LTVNVFLKTLKTDKRHRRTASNWQRSVPIALGYVSNFFSLSVAGVEIYPGFFLVHLLNLNIMVFRVNKHTLEPERVNLTKRIVIFVVLTASIVGLALYNFGFSRGKDVLSALSDEEKLVIIQEFNAFSEDKLIAKLTELNVKFPYIVLAQSKLETGNYTSKIFKENNNLFGMREAKQRITTAIGTEHNHAYYHSWHESVLDYAFYQCRYLSGINTEEQYFNYLRQSYAEDPSYVNRLITIVTNQKLKDKFK
jgi:hypothetical protein